MKVKILGSGGCVPLPLPTCFCDVCNEAREKGAPYSRGGCSIFLEDMNALVDTPEDVINTLCREKVENVESILFSHWDPDHTLGMRVIEALKLNWFDVYLDKKKPEKSINVIALNDVIHDLKQIRNKYGSYIEYYQGMGLIDIHEKEENESFMINDVKVTIIPVRNGGDVASIFVFEKEEEGVNKKFIYAPCDIKPFPIDNEAMKEADLMVIGNTIPDEPLKNGVIIPEDNNLKKELFTMDEIVEIKNNYNMKKVIITHLEEDWGKSLDDYKRLEQEKYYHVGIGFAFDGMELEI